MFQEFPEDNRNDDFLNEFRQKLADQSAAALEEKRREIRHSKNVFIGALSGVALAGVVGWLVLSPQYAKENPADIPVIRRPQTAVKIRPVEPGGMEIQNQDKSVYDIIEKKDEDNNVKIENLLPPPETPHMPVITPPETVTAEIPAQNTVAEDIEPTDKTVNEKNIAELPEPKTINEAAEAPVKKIAETEDVPAEKVSVPAKEDIKIVIKEPIEAAPTQAANGDWQLQMMSSPNKSAIEKSWISLSKKYSSLQGLPHEIETANLGAKGIFYRLKAGGFKTKGEADKLCSEIKSLGGSCIVKKK